MYFRASKCHKNFPKKKQKKKPLNSVFVCGLQLKEAHTNTQAWTLVKNEAVNLSDKHVPHCYQMGFKLAGDLKMMSLTIGRDK